MSILFAGVSTQYLENTSTPPVTGPPFTMACWYRATSIPTYGQALISLNDGSNTNFFSLRSLQSTGQIIALTLKTGFSQGSTTSGGVSVGVWAHACGVFPSTTSRTAYLDGIAATENTGSSVPTGITQMNIARLPNSTQRADGDIGEVSIWNVALTAAEVAVLASGVSPLFVRPASLVYYGHLHGDYSPEIDLIRGYNMTYVNSPVRGSQHPRILNPFAQGHIQTKYTPVIAWAGAQPNYPSIHPDAWVESVSSGMIPGDADDPIDPTPT